MAVVSSCREMLVKSRNERNPLSLCCPARMVGTQGETAGDKPEEGGMTSSHHGPTEGYTCYVMARTEGCKLAIVSESQKKRVVVRD